MLAIPCLKQLHTDIFPAHLPIARCCSRTYTSLNRVSMANVKPGAPLLWVHLISAYVITFITLKVMLASLLDC